MLNTEANNVSGFAASQTKRIHVAVGIIQNDRHQVLIAKRAEHLHQGGLWEFPGGKVEKNETVHDALRRELYEELGIVVETASPFIKIYHDYADKSVLLDVWRVETFTGTAQGKEMQPLAWVDITRLYDYAVPPANKSIVAALRLPREMVITGDWVDEMDFEEKLLHALQRGIKLVQLRAHQCTEQEFYLLFARAKKICDEYDTLLIANTSPGHFAKLKSDGLHLTSIELLKCDSRPVQKNILLGASCHSLEQIKQAERIGVDYITLSPVFKTGTHPDHELLGFENFSELARGTSILVFALGGIKIKMLAQIKEAGAYGVASISEWWEPASSR